MRKWTARANPKSAWSRALPMENVFVLLGRDPAAPQTIRNWAAFRLLHAHNSPHDEQIQEALRLADRMEEERAALRGIIHGTPENMADPALIPPPIPEAE